MRNDSDLIRAYANSGEEEAFAEIVRRHGGMVYRTCLRLLSDAHAAEDASQSTFEVLVRKARSLRRKSDLAAWLHDVARKAALMARRTASRRARREEEVGMIRPARWGTGVAEQHALAEFLDGELARLPRGERQAVILRYLEGRNESESAEIAGCPVGTLSRRASQGLARLRSRLSKREASLGAGGLVAALAAEAAAPLPGTLLPSMLAATQTAAAGASGAATGVGLITEGVLKAMFWTKIKIAAGIVAAATVVAGAGTPLAIRAAAGGGDSGEKKPTVGSTSKVIRARVIRVNVAGGLPPKALVTIAAGKSRGVRKGFVFDVLREGKPLNARYPRELKIESVSEKESTGTYPLASGLPVERPRVGDLATTRLTVVDPGNGSEPNVGVETKAVNGLRLRIFTPDDVFPEIRTALAGPISLDMNDETLEHAVVTLGRMTGLSIAIRGVGARQAANRPVTLRFEKRPVREVLDSITRQHPDLPWKVAGGRFIWFGRSKGPGTESRDYCLRWENVSKKPLVLHRDRCCDLYDRVFMTGPDGKPVPARTDNRARFKHLGRRTIRIEPGKFDEERFDPWHWVQKPVKPGEYTLWVGFERKTSPKQPIGPADWFGKVRSNAVKIRIGEPETGAVNGLRLSLRLNSRIRLTGNRWFGYSPDCQVRIEGDKLVVTTEGKMLYTVPRAEVLGVEKVIEGAVLRWENVAAHTLYISRAAAWDLDGKVSLEDPAGRPVAARRIERHVDAGLKTLRLAPGAHHDEPFCPWLWLRRPAKQGRYSLQLSFEARARKTAGPKPWSGRVSTETAAFTFRPEIANHPYEAVRSFLDRYDAEDWGLCLSMLAPGASWRGRGNIAEFIKKLSGRKFKPLGVPSFGAWAQGLSHSHSWSSGEAPASLKAAAGATWQRGDRCQFSYSPEVVMRDGKPRVHGVFFLLRKVRGEWKVAFIADGYFPVDGLKLKAGPPPRAQPREIVREVF